MEGEAARERRGVAFWALLWSSPLEPSFGAIVNEDLGSGGARAIEAQGFQVLLAREVLLRSLGWSRPPRRSLRSNLAPPVCTKFAGSQDKQTNKQTNIHPSLELLERKPPRTEVTALWTPLNTKFLVTRGGLRCVAPSRSGSRCVGTKNLEPHAAAGALAAVLISGVRSPYPPSWCRCRCCRWCRCCCCCFHRSSSRVPALQVQFVRRTSPLRQPAIWSPSERVCEFACLCLCL